jgi:hypothetical protein
MVNPRHSKMAIKEVKKERPNYGTTLGPKESN